MLNESKLYICNIRNKIIYHGKLKLNWIRVHKENRGNERDNQLAKEVTNKLNIDISFHPSKSLHTETVGIKIY